MNIMLAKFTYIRNVFDFFSCRCQDMQQHTKLDCRPWLDVATCKALSMHALVPTAHAAESSHAVVTFKACLRCLGHSPAVFDGLSRSGMLSAQQRGTPVQVVAVQPIVVD